MVHASCECAALRYTAILAAKRGLVTTTGATCRPKGVYFGWAQLQRHTGKESSSDGAVAPMVLNCGVRPTIKDGSHTTVRSLRFARANCAHSQKQLGMLYVLSKSLATDSMHMCGS